MLPVNDKAIVQQISACIFVFRKESRKYGKTFIQGISFFPVLCIIREFLSKIRNTFFQDWQNRYEKTKNLLCQPQKLYVSAGIAYYFCICRNTFPAAYPLRHFFSDDPCGSPGRCGSTSFGSNCAVSRGRILFPFGNPGLALVSFRDSVAAAAFFSTSENRLSYSLSLYSHFVHGSYFREAQQKIRHWGNTCLHRTSRCYQGRRRSSPSCLFFP